MTKNDQPARWCPYCERMTTDYYGPNMVCRRCRNDTDDTRPISRADAEREVHEVARDYGFDDPRVQRPGRWRRQKPL